MQVRDLDGRLGRLASGLLIMAFSSGSFALEAWTIRPEMDKTPWAEKLRAVRARLRSGR